MTDLPTIQAQLNKSRKDKFTLVLTLPRILKSIESRTPRIEDLINLDSLQFSIYNVTIPTITVPEIPMQYGGQNYNVTSYNRPPYPPCTINFAIDNEFKNYWVLWKWLQLLNDSKDATYAGSNVFPEGKPDLVPNIKYDYQTDIIVYSKDEYNKNKIEFTFKYAFITKLGELVYNYRDPEEMDCYFEFAFNQLDVHLV